jgi:predicted aspartyl protease
VPPSLRVSPLLLCLTVVLIFASSSTTCAQSPTAVEQASVKAHSQNAGSDLDRLVREKRYPELERELPSSHLTATERSYFEGILADRRNHVPQAIAILENLVPSLRTANRSRAAATLRTLAGDYFKVGRYADASDVYSDLLKHFAANFEPAEKRAIGDNQQTFEWLRGAAPQTISGVRSFSVPTQRDPIGDLDVPLQIGEAKQWWIFDTGANVSTITSSTARRLGLIISKGQARTQGGATGAEVPLRTAVIPQLTFGEAILHNVVALVTDDKALDIDLGKNGHYQIQGILGYPVLAALGSFTVTGDEMVVSPNSQGSARSTSLYVEELTPLVMATVNGQDLLFGFDTGSSSAEFTSKYLHEFPRQFASLKTTEMRFGGAGGERMLPVYHLPQVEVVLGRAAAQLKNVPVLARDRGVDPLDQVFGNLGQGLLNQFRTYTIDFSDMRLSVGENVR